jgi:formylglycine-generating enzyme required for sulfatase activity
VGGELTLGGVTMTNELAIPSIVADLPARQDALGFGPYVDALVDILLDENMSTPLTMGVYGPWGSGKTSLMTMLKERLDARRKQARRQAREGEIVRSHLSVWFNAWLYDRDEALWRTLTLCVLAELRREMGRDPEVRRALDKMEADLTRSVEPASLGELIIGGRALVSGGNEEAEFRLPLATGLGFLQEVAQVRAEAPDADAAAQAAAAALMQTAEQTHTALNRERVEAVKTFRQDFQTLVKRYVHPGFLVVFVDDLDRCPPDKALQVLQAIKLFLDVPGCIFVLGLDPEAIRDAVRTRYRDEAKAREYLEKIIQLPFILPDIEDEAMRGYVKSLAPSLPDARCGEVFAQGLKPNPRQVKRTLNIFLLLSRLVEKQEMLAGLVTPVRLAKVVAIQHAHPDLYDLLRLRPGYLAELEAFFRAGEEGRRMGEGEEAGPRLPEALEPFTGREVLRRLLCLFDEEDARFDGLKPLEVRSYLTLTRRTTPVEAPAVRVARRPIEPEMVSVPAGPFLMGTSDEQVQDMLRRFDWAKEAKEKGWFDDEQPQHEVTLPAFEIGRYPVTNAEYAAFVQATGRQPPRHWGGDRFPEELADHPVVDVNWHVAVAYAEWLREQTGRPYRLPTEAEWEKAARGEDGRLWPWGNDWDPARANCKPDGPGRTTPVGQYSPAGDSPYGAADMAGNVYGWTQSLHRDYRYDPEDGREDLEAGGNRVLRGGAFGSVSWLVRCAYRDWLNPVDWFRHCGFRVVVAPNFTSGR